MAEVNQQVHALQSVDYEEYLDIRPPEGEEWFIANIYHEKEAALLKSNGTDEITIITDSDPEGGAWSMFKFFVTHDHFLRILNLNSEAAPALLGYEGVRIR